MRYALTSLARNLLAGLRLACFLPIRRLEFRIDLAQLMLLFVVSAAIDIFTDWSRTGPERAFSAWGAGTEFFAGAVLLFLAALLALLFRQRDLTMAIPAVVLASLPIMQLLHGLHNISAGLTASWPGLAYALDSLLIVWLIGILVRSVYVVLAPSARNAGLRAIGGGLLLSTPIWFSTSIAPNHPWWIDADVPAANGLSAGSETVLAAQSFLLENALESLEPERGGQADLYFVGFAPYGRQDVFRKDVEAAQKVMDERWGTAGRSITLINNPQTLLTTPFATVTNLREAMNEIGAAIDVAEDVVMLYVASHGSRDHKLSTDLPPLSLVELSPTGLKQILDGAQIKWRIVVVSACFSGGYIAALKDDYTMIVTASQADRISFGCGDRSDATFFGEAFFQRGLASVDTFQAAFELAQVRVAERERDAGYSPSSNPQIFIGDAMAEKLRSLRYRRGVGGATAEVRPGLR